MINGKEITIIKKDHVCSRTNPFLWYRFSESMRVPLVEIISRKNVNFVLVNSVAMERDGCGLCNEAERLVSYIGSKYASV